MKKEKKLLPKFYIYPITDSDSNRRRESSKSKMELQKAVDRMKEGLGIVFSEIGGELIKKPKEMNASKMELEFGIGVTTGLDFILVNGKGEFNMKVKVTWDIK